MNIVKMVLILASNPKDSKRVPIDREIQGIRDALQRSNGRDKFEIVNGLALDWNGFNQELLNSDPDIVHFVGHGLGKKGLVLEGANDCIYEVSSDRLVKLFREFPRLQCVVLDACHSRVQAEALQGHVPYAIGMRRTIAADSSLEFAIGFYQAIFAGKSYGSAFEIGRNSIVTHAYDERSPLLYSSKDVEEEIGTIANLENPGRKMLMTSPFYIARSNLEDGIYQQLLEPGGLVRIKAPRQFGKSSLMSRVVAKLEGVGAQTVSIDFREIEPRHLEDLDVFLKWFCRQVTRSLDLSTKVDQEWDEDGGMGACRDYFEDHVLPMISDTLVLEMDDVDELLSESIGDWKIQFLKMLRAWFERGRSDQRWGKLRMVLVHSREIGKETIADSHSPFNVGDETRLPAFKLDQVKELVKRHGLLPVESIAERLMTLVNGHPYLVRRALYEMGSQTVSIDQILVDVTTRSGIYGNHLQKLQSNLDNKLQICSLMRMVVASGEAGAIVKGDVGTTLQDLGLVRFQGDRLQVTCELYRVYFSRCWT